MNLDFNACLLLLALWFVLSLGIVRCFLAVVNRGFLLVDYARERLYPEGKKTGYCTRKIQTEMESKGFAGKRS